MKMSFLLIISLIITTIASPIGYSQKQRKRFEPSAPDPQTAPLPSTPHNKVIVGEREMIYLDPPGKYFDARIDTGATTSSLHAQDIVWFKKDGKNLVRFNMNHDGTDRIVERPVVSTVLVQQVNNPEPVIRPVVSMFTIIGGIEMEANFGLADRSKMTLPVLIGRDIIKDRMIVDVSYRYIHKMNKELEK